MTRYTLSEFYNIRRSMKKRLTVYMITLGLILAAALIAGLFFFNQLKSPQEELCTSLSFRMEAFETDMKSMWRNVSVMGVHLSEDMSAIVQRQTSKLSALDGSADAMERLEEAMLEPLCQYVRRTAPARSWCSTPPSAARSSAAACTFSGAILRALPAICCSTAAWRASDAVTA